MRRPINLIIRGIFLSILPLLCTTSCQKDGDPGEPESSLPAHIVTQKRYAKILLTEKYYWANDVLSYYYANMSELDAMDDPIEFFNTLRGQRESWSYITDDIDNKLSQDTGTGFTFGYNLAYYYDDNSRTTLRALVRHVYPGTTVEKAGIKRGDWIEKMNGHPIHANNYTELTNARALELELSNGRTVSLQAELLYKDPIIHQDIIEKNGKKIGYLFFTSYLLGSQNDSYKPLRDLNNVFTRFKNENVDEVILDLRYNGGGKSLTANYLNHLLAPLAAIHAKETYRINVNYNAKETSYSFATPFSITSNEESMNIPYTGNLDLNRLYILCSNRTASASEATIATLQPFMEVVLIGSPTRGKSFGGPVLRASELTGGTYDTPVFGSNQYLINWGSYILNYRITNRDNYIYYPAGIPVQYEAAEDPDNLYPLGDEKDPLLAKALEVITGAPAPAQTRTAFTSKQSLTEFIPIWKNNPEPEGMIETF